MKRERIAVVSHAHPSVSSGGAEISAYTLFRGLLDAGEDAYFVSACREDDLSRLELKEPDREFFIPFQVSEHDWLYHVSPRAVEDQLIATLDRIAPTIVNFHHFIYLGTQALLAVSRDPSVRTSLTLHEFLALCQTDGQLVTREHRRLCTGPAPGKCVTCWPEFDANEFATRIDYMREMLGSMAQLISPSEFLRDRFVANGFDRTPIRVIENGLARVPERQPTRPDAGDRPWVFGYFGQINPYKGVDVLLRAVEQQAATGAGARPWTIRVHGHLVGQGAVFADRLEAAVATGLLEFAGPYQNEHVGALMGACDYVIVPSLWWENSPVVIQEAFAVGRPLLVSGIGGMAEKVVDQVSGLHFMPGSAPDLLRTMAVAADVDVHTRLSSNLPTPLTATDMARRYLAAWAETPGEAGTTGERDPALVA